MITLIPISTPYQSGEPEVDINSITYVENLGRSIEMAGKVSLDHFRNTLSTLLTRLVTIFLVNGWSESGDRTYPGDQDKLWEARIGIPDFHEGKLNLAIVEFFNEILELALCKEFKRMLVQSPRQGRQSGRWKGVNIWRAE